MASLASNLLGSRSAGPLERAARIVVVAVLIAIGVDHVVYAIVQWPLHDMDTYLAAATRLREGLPLYTPGVLAIDSYWYAPWYAVAWIPFSFLPRIVVAAIWSGVLLAATGTVTVMLARMGRSGPMLALLFGPPLFAVSAGGNVQPLMVLSLLWGLNRRSGPIWVGVAASMKYTPILLGLVYLARREWSRAAWTLVLGAGLIAPALALGITNASLHSTTQESLLSISLPLYVVAVGAACAVTLLVRSRYATVSAAVAAVLALPRLFVYDVTLIAAGVVRGDGPPRPSSRRSGQGGRQ
jgi:Glycosyltransferase family 87